MNKYKIKSELEELKTLLLFYHGEPIRKVKIDECIENIENKLDDEEKN